MIFDKRAFTPRRYLVLLASKPVGKQEHGRVWLKSDNAWMVDAQGKVECVTTVVQWLKTADLLKLGPTRALGGNYLVPTVEGLGKLESMIHGEKE